MADSLVDVSKFLSFVLRHDPRSIGITLDIEGWADLDELLERARAAGRSFDRNMIEQLLDAPGKKRFALSQDGRRIRASQGHTTSDVAIDYPKKIPPAKLLHGTAERFMASIDAQGLRAGERHYVHLTDDEETALSTGRRYGKPVLVVVDAAGMAARGHVFHQAENGVWLTKSVPPDYLSKL